MRLEEEVILLTPKRLLTLADWTMVDAAFASNHEPFARAGLKGDLEKLFSLIVTIIPAPTI